MMTTPRTAAPRAVEREEGPAWVFGLWRRAWRRCQARTTQGTRCHRLVNLQAGVSRCCDRHRGASTPVYYVTARVEQIGCPCGCGYAVLVTVLTAHPIAGAPSAAPADR